MCNHPLHPFLVSLPKTEHHMHLEGSLSPELLFRLSAKNNIPLPSPETDPAFSSVESLYERYSSFTSLDDFLHYYYIGFTVLVHESDFEELAYAYLSTQSREANLRHAEVFFDPQVHIARGISIETIVSGWESALQKVQKEGVDISAQLIPCFLRHLDVKDSERCLSLLLSGGFFKPPNPAEEKPSSRRLEGIGLCSTELDKPPSTWAHIFTTAKQAGITNTTAHAGEEGPAEYITAALDDLHVTRIDHGVSAADDENLMDRLAKEQVLVTVCPVSNVRLRVKQKLEQVPLRRFMEKGVRFSLNSDDPAYFGGYLQSVYCAVQEVFGFTVAQWAVIARNGVEGSWCGEERKRVLMGEVEGVVGAWAGKEEGGRLGWFS
ncbi:adenosine deaminase [Rhypophila decipiens]|uniref:Adenine deaminase n=1 Tax=Rhypophila decipiens TaxID=261697 RepID=A0AAN7B1M9_9PEZI|nr:adenosine deaminase [Rhypophila decipiens]